MTKTEQSEKKDNPRPVCFVVGPIGESGSETRRRADWLLKGVIVPTFNDHFSGFEIKRADTISSPGMIDVQLIEMLFEAELVIVDMSETNANAFYEMGIRHAFSKPVIHMFAQGTKIPFDVAPHRAIPFSIDHIEDLWLAGVALKDAVTEAIKPGFTVINPVTRALGLKKFETTATPEMQLLWDEISELRRLISDPNLRKPFRRSMQEFKPLEARINLLMYRPDTDIRAIIAAASPEYGVWCQVHQEDSSLFISLPIDIPEDEMNKIGVALRGTPGIVDVWGRF
ncbi:MULTISPECIES: hypothetical protein [unclassified Rhizobium]|uniref:hypothetical protein n=1 Tax=unclassified Rhizobium TaxID=2613769 RepID=UPI0016156A8E|nr:MULTISPECIES: hypothetical protein [unclassified Rhizobium]MBB3385711.1 hypothetical protein [Rhizobium sp. BK098]MBB3617416.1 hypothetical protein [Rhizobium sp. BK609]MBB3682748.1 hypothetical protein [Rhizobium sp. BK612]